MPTIYIDNQAFEVAPGQNLLAVCLTLGFDLPYFCWHPAMGSVGACRQCAVKQFKDENDREGKIVMACLTPADDGVRISIEDPEAKAFRKGVAEWLMASHPHDCPVCDEGGECHLQDMTVMNGQVSRRYRFTKRTFRNQDLGPFVNHEMNRCIQCYRCVRFYHDYAGGHDLVALGIRNEIYFGRHADGKLESEFSGNLVEVCPTGVFTDKTFKAHFTRKWDLQTAPSVCVHCGLGCNTIPGERYGLLRRIRSRYNGHVNGYFICDRGRFGYEFVNAESRLRDTMMAAQTPHAAGSARSARGAVSARPAPPEDVVAHVADLIRTAARSGRRVVGISSPRASLEANYALRDLVGEDNFFSGMSDHEDRLVRLIIGILVTGPSRGSSLRELERADATFILGEDVTNTAPMLDYSLRQWLRRRPNPERTRLKIPAWNDAAVGEIVHEEPSALYIATVAATKLDESAAEVYRAAPDDLARLGFAVAHLVDDAAPPVPELPADIHDLAVATAQALTRATRPIIVSGVSCGSEAVVKAAANVAWSLRARGEAAELCFVVSECNSIGLGMMGGRPLSEALQAADDPGVELAIVLENDLFRRAGEAEVERFLGLCGHLAVVDHSETRTTAAADIVLPAATFAESTGTLVNSEPRAQRFYQVFVPAGDVRESWRWLQDVRMAAGGVEGDTKGEIEGGTWHSVDDVLDDLCLTFPMLAPALSAAPPAEFRVHGMRVPRQPARYSGRTAMYADQTVFEPRPPDDRDSPLAFSMEGSEEQPPPALVSRVWVPGWNSAQALERFQEEVGGALRGGDPGKRLFEPPVVERPSHFLDVPAAYSPERDQSLVVPVHHIFGSEELSMKAPAVRECAPEPYLGLCGLMAERLGISDGGVVTLVSDAGVRLLKAKLFASLPDYVAVIPAGLPGLEGLGAPFYARLIARKDADD